MTAEGEITSVEELVTRIRQGMVSHSVRLFAAQGLLPVSREELIRVLVLLAADGDIEISGTANTTLAGFDREFFMHVLEQPDLDSLEVDLIARTRQDELIWDAVVRHPMTANETLRWLARLGPPSVQTSIMTNQRRMFGCLELLGDLRANPAVGQDVLRRIREFEEEFLEKAIVWASAEQFQAEEVEEGPSIEDALSALKAIGMQIPGGEVEPERLPEPDGTVPQEIRDAYVRIAMMNVFQRIMCALKGTREERLILVRDRNLLVVRAVINSPQMNEIDIEHIAGMRGVCDEVFRQIVSKPRWTRRYGVLRALVFNPKTPQAIALQLVRRLSMRDFSMLGRDRNVSEAVRRAARRENEQRR
jgi:hypothetical protein